MPFSLTLRTALLGITATALLGCSDAVTPPDPDPTVVASVSVSPTPITLAAGASRELTAVPRNAEGQPLTGRILQWTSDNEVVATVSTLGVVTAHASGATLIRATSEGKVGTASVTVTAAPPPSERQVVSVSLDAITASIEEGGTRQFVATPRDADGEPIGGLGMQWSSTEATIAAVNSIGVVTGIRPGAATITVRVHGVTAQASVAVFAQYDYDLVYSQEFGAATELVRLNFSQPEATSTRLLPEGTSAGEARISPDGTKIVFTGRVDGVQGIYVANRDGSQLTRIVTRETGPVVHPTWSPDGSKIAYQTHTGSASPTRYDIYIVNADGTNPVNLTADLGSTDQYAPSWSPLLADGTSRIAFVHHAGGTQRVWTMRADGTDRKQITSGAHDVMPAWSPNGQTLVFSRTTAFVNGDLWLVDANGTNERAVMVAVSLAGPQSFPSFTPDGRMIGFASQHETWGMGSERFELYTVWVDGSKLARRTTGGGMWPAWLPR